MQLMVSPVVVVRAKWGTELPEISCSHLAASIDAMPSVCHNSPPFAGSVVELAIPSQLLPAMDQMVRVYKQIQCADDAML